MAIDTIGASGQPFNLEVLPKIRAARQYFGDSAEIIIDGGITDKTARLCREAGADGVVVNSYFWANPQANLRKLTNLR